MVGIPVIRIIKQYIDSNELAWTFPLPPWVPLRQRKLRTLRRIARKRLRTQLISRQGWLRTITQTLAWPVISTLKAAVAAKRHSTLSLTGKLGLFANYCWLQWAHNIRISDQDQHALMFPSRRRQANDYMICRENQALLDMAHQRSSGYPALADKQVFAVFCTHAGLPAPTCLAQGIGSQIEIFTEWPETDLVLKPSNLGKGQGIEILRYQAAHHHWMAADGTTINSSSISAYAARQFGPLGPWLLQPRLINSRDWDQFAPACLATVRIVTGRSEKNSEPSCIAAYLRLPRKGAIIDNLSAGGIGIQLDIHTGRLDKGHIYLGNFREHSHHPDTGTPIEGVELPRFQELVQLALRAHSLAGDWSSIGWDVTLTEEGPMLIEANLHWAIFPRCPIINSRYLGIFHHALGLRDSTHPV
jgi:hypothetical protein